LTEFQQVKEFILNKLKKELPGYLAYHNIDHTLDVLQAAENIAVHEGVNGNDKRLLLTAALFHDSGFLIGRDEHEVKSCSIARLHLPDYSYGPDEIDLICGLIMATKLPQTPHNLLQAILCDADLDYLGRADFFILSARLFTELKDEGLMKDENEWNLEQTNFISNHHYHTPTSVRLRQSQKEQYIELIKSKISNQIFDGDA